MVSQELAPAAKCWKVTDSTSGERWVLFSAPPDFRDEKAFEQHLLESGVMLTSASHADGKSSLTSAVRVLKGVLSNPAGIYSADVFVRPGFSRTLVLDIRSDNTFVLESFLKATRPNGSSVTLKHQRFKGDYRIEKGRVRLLFSEDASTSLELSPEAGDLITCNSMQLRYRKQAR